MINSPMKVTNYGQKEYILYYNYAIKYDLDQKKYTKVMDREAKQTLAPYLININNNKEIIKIITQYYKEFQRFVKIGEKKIIKRNKEIKIFYYRISQAFLSYLKQTKEKLEPLMMEDEYEEKIKYIKDDKQRKDQIYGGIMQISGYRKISELKINKINNYEIIVKKLEKYYERINPQNEEKWEKYIDTEVQKMKTMLHSQDALEKMQEEYKKIYEEKIQK